MEGKGEKGVEREEIGIGEMKEKNDTGSRDRKMKRNRKREREEWEDGEKKRVKEMVLKGEMEKRRITRKRGHGEKGKWGWREKGMERKRGRKRE